MHFVCIMSITLAFQFISSTYIGRLPCLLVLTSPDLKIWKSLITLLDILWTESNCETQEIILEIGVIVFYPS